MKFEKINKDKIKVTLDNEDLIKNCIDLHSFMSNSKESHSLFLDVLEKAEKDYCFSTENYNLKVETLALSDGNFILTITRVLESDAPNQAPRKKLRVTRKKHDEKISVAIYKFNTFDDFCNLTQSLNTTTLINIDDIFSNSILYSYNNNYYLILDDIHVNNNANSLFALLTEFSTYVSSSNSYISKLHENGNLIFKNRAIQNCEKFFIK